MQSWRFVCMIAAIVEASPAFAATYSLNTIHSQFQIYPQWDLPGFQPITPVTSVPQSVVKVDVRFDLNCNKIDKNDIAVNSITLNIAGYSFSREQVFVDYDYEPNGSYETIFVGAVINDVNWQWLDDNRNMQILTDFGVQPFRAYTDNDFNLRCFIFEGFNPNCQFSYDRAGYVAHFISSSNHPAQLSIVPEPAT